MSTYIIQTNLPTELVIVDAIPIDNNDLIYSLGGSFADGTLVKVDNVIGNKNIHKGNPKLLPEETPVYKKCNKVSVINETIVVQSAPITRGLYRYEPLVLNSDLKTDSSYYWDEIYTSPLGYFSCSTNPTLLTFEFGINGNILTLLTNDVNIVPKVGDFIIFQKLPAGYTKNSDINMSPTIDGSVWAGIFSDGISNFPVIFNTETYQLKITDVTFSIPGAIGLKTNYTIILDKSLAAVADEEYSLILLNRENTGLQKELFYDTFEQIEVQREQLIGDPYFETSLAKPNGKQNTLYYNNAQYLGLRNLLSGVLKSNEAKFLNTPFIVYDIDDEIKDRFCTTPSTTGSLQFEFHLPTVMLQDDVDNKLNVLVNYGAVQTDITGAGKYSGLYLKWQESLNKRFGYIFYDLRIIVIDDAELATALGYNSNRNYTLPKIQLTSAGNITTNVTSSVSLDIIGLQPSNVEPMLIIVSGPHNLKNGDVITITDIKTRVLGSNLIHSSNANGIRYIKRYFSDPTNPATEVLDRFYIYSDQGLTTSFPDDGVFVNAGIGQSGKVRGAKLKYNYFITYRIKNKRYSSILPHSELISFNFATSSIDSSINNNSGAAYISLPPFTYLDNGYEIDDLEFIVGEWEAINSAKPYDVTGYKNVVVLSSQDIVGVNSASNISTTTYILTKGNYDTAVSKIDNGLGSYDFATNPTGDPKYDILNNFKHYNIINGTLSPTLNTSVGKWTLGNIKYKTEAEQYRSKLQIVVAATEWNDTMNPSYDPNNEFITSKYISEIAICDTTSEQPIIYTKIAPPIKKTGDLDILINLSLDF
ncbi:MAG: hypothetical protein ABIP51_23225 [Bacteroidia bacterium]